MELTGHSGEVFCGQFDPNGNYIASGSMDRSISESQYAQLRSIRANTSQCCGEPTVTARTTGPWLVTKAPF
jgi:WD40 repeat protein